MTEIYQTNETERLAMRPWKYNNAKIYINHLICFANSERRYMKDSVWIDKYDKLIKWPYLQYE